jgi:hypothetical protein
MLVFSISTLFGKVCAQTTTATTTNNVIMQQRAVEGDKVWVIINHIKADKRDQFERFVHEIFWPMASKLRAQEQQVFRQTRVLHPTKAEEDGTYSYIFIMDPVIQGADYDINSLLKKMYGAQKGAEYGKMFDETVAREQTQYLDIQSKD